MGRFTVVTPVAASPQACFALSLSPEAHTASMGRSGERVVDGTRTGTMGLGDTVTFAARHFGVPFRLTSTITALEEPSRFVDEQVRGPFARWHHEHRFDATPDGCTATDVVDYRAPLGPLGRLVERLVLDRYLRHLLVERGAWIAAELAG